MTTREIFEKFKQVCPNATQEFDPANLANWHHHIRNSEQMPKLKPIFFDKEPLRALQEKRKISRFEDFPEPTRWVYLQIASCFPFVQVYAAGSRVDGSYLNTAKDSETAEARARAGKSNRASDYDFIAQGKPIYTLPFRADHLKVQSEKIPLPMWNIEKLPEHEHAKVIELLRLNDQQGLAEIHNRYQLSSYEYCCNLEPVVRHFRYAVDNGTIKSPD